MVLPTGNQVFKPMCPRGVGGEFYSQATATLIWRLQRWQVDIGRNLELVGEH